MSTILVGVYIAHKLHDAGSLSSETPRELVRDAIETPWRRLLQRVVHSWTRTTVSASPRVSQSTNHRQTDGRRVCLSVQSRNTHNTTLHTDTKTKRVIISGPVPANPCHTLSNPPILIRSANPNITSPRTHAQLFVRGCSHSPVTLSPARAKRYRSLTSLDFEVSTRLQGLDRTKAG